MNKQQAVIESGRAEFALKAVKDVKEHHKNNAKEYKSYARKFPSLVLINGLAAAVAFAAFAVDKSGMYKLLYNNIAEWLKQNGLLSGKNLEEYVCSLNSDEYRVVTNEVLALFEWLRRFASGLIEGDGDSD